MLTRSRSRLDPAVFHSLLRELAVNVPPAYLRHLAAGGNLQVRLPGETALDARRRFRRLLESVTEKLARLIAAIIRGPLEEWMTCFPQVRDPQLAAQETAPVLARWLALILLGMKRYPRRAIRRMAGRQSSSLKSRLDTVKRNSSLNAWNGRVEDLINFLGRALLALKMDTFRRIPDEPFEELAGRLTRYTKVSSWQERSRSYGLLAALVATEFGKLRLAPLALCGRCQRQLSLDNRCDCPVGTSQVIRPTSRFIVHNSESFLVPMLRCSGKDCGRLWHGTLLQPCPRCRAPLMSLPISVVHTVSPTMRKLPDNADDSRGFPWGSSHPGATIPLLDRFGAYGLLEESLTDLRKAALAEAADRGIPLNPGDVKELIQRIRHWLAAEHVVLLHEWKLGRLKRCGSNDLVRLAELDQKLARHRETVDSTAKEVRDQAKVTGGIRLWADVLADALGLDDE